jgi:hypothetical protein
VGDGLHRTIAIHAIQRRADIDLVGVWVHSQDKVGKDAGELATESRSELPPPTTPTV